MKCCYLKKCIKWTLSEIFCFSLIFDSIDHSFFQNLQNIDDKFPWSKWKKNIKHKYFDLFVALNIFLHALLYFILYLICTTSGMVRRFSFIRLFMHFFQFKSQFIPVSSIKEMFRLYVGNGIWIFFRHFLLLNVQSEMYYGVEYFLFDSILNAVFLSHF